MLLVSFLNVFVAYCTCYFYFIKIFNNDHINANNYDPCHHVTMPLTQLFARENWGLKG